MREKTTSTTRRRSPAPTTGPYIDSEGPQHQAVRKDLEALREWLKTHDLAELRKICQSVAGAVQRSDSRDGETICWRILDRMLPSGVDRLLTALLTRPTSAFFAAIDQIAPAELSEALRSIALEHAPNVIARSSDDGETWRSLDAALCTAADGDQELMLKFTRTDGQALTMRGSPRAALREVVPKILRVAALAEDCDIDANDLEVLRVLLRGLERKLRRHRMRSNP